jgi:putative ABC transport system substrate-binding protein
VRENLKSEIENPKSEDSAECAGACRQGDQMTVRSEQSAVGGMTLESQRLAKRRSVFIFLLLAGLLPAVSETQQLPRIGYLTVGSPAATPARYEGFRQGLRDLGYVEGKNIVVEYRYSEGKLDRLRDLAGELVRLKVDVIVTGGPTPTRIAKEVTKAIPIVMTFDSDPVGNGFVASLGRPGGNITGLSNVAPEVSGKRLELLKEIVPTLSRVAVFGMSSNPGNALSLKETELAARALGVQIQFFDIRDSKNIEAAFRSASKERFEGILALNFPHIIKATRVAALAVKTGLPAIYFESSFVEQGGLMSYGTSLADLDRRAAVYVDKILKGAKPAELPIEQPTKFELVINLKTAKQIGLAIPPNLLARADRVIK